MATTKNAEVVDLLQTIGDLMELRGEAPYRVRAYREAARQLDQITEDVTALSEAGQLTTVRGVGPSIARTIEEHLATGRSAQLDRLRQEVPDSLIELLGLRHFGPQRISTVHKALGVTSLDELEAAAHDGRLLTVPGFGAKSAAALLASIAAFRERRGHIPRYLAEAAAQTALRDLGRAPGAAQVALTGDVRRRCETTRQIDFLVAADTPAPVVAAFTSLPICRQVSGQNGHGAAALTREGWPLRLRVVSPRLWGQALQHFTGSQSHNAQLQERARAAGLGITSRPAAESDEPSWGQPDESGAWPGFFLEADGQALAAPDEADVYRRLGLPVIPPELREGRGEVEAAAAGRLPRLIELADIRGDLHLHTTWSDGSDGVETMARRALALGREYIAISDHSQSLGVARGLSLERLSLQRQEIADVDAALEGIRLLSSVELDIRADGTLDYPDETLAQFDFVTASIHSGFQQPAERLTGRVLAALRSPHVDAIGHLTGRVLGRRDPLELDVEAILQAAATTATAMEINAWPNRLDLGEEHARRARELGVKLVINTDSHAADQLAYMRYGVDVARRAWLQPEDVLNTLPLDDLLAYLRRRRGKG